MKKILNVICLGILLAGSQLFATTVATNGFKITYTKGSGFKIVQGETVISNNSLFLCMEPGWKNHWFYAKKHQVIVTALANGIEIKSDPANPSTFVLEYLKLTVTSPESFTITAKGQLSEAKRAFITHVILNLSESVMTDAQFSIDGYSHNLTSTPFKNGLIVSRNYEIKIEVIKGPELVIKDRTKRPYMRHKGFIVMENRHPKAVKAKVYEQEIKVTLKPSAGAATPQKAVKIASAKLRKSDFFGQADNNMTLAAIVSKEKNYNGKFSWDDYRALLKELAKPRYKVVQLKDFSQAKSNDKIIVGMRHDIDSHPEKALLMSDIEKEFGLTSTYLFLHSAKYYGKVKNNLMIRNAGFDKLALELYKAGFEIGIHTDLFTMMWKYQYDPVAFIKAEIAYYKQLGIPIIGSAAHGASNVIRKKVNNTWIFADFGRSGSIVVNGKHYDYGNYHVKDFGLKYEGYHLKKNYYTGDIDRSLRGKPVSALIKKIQQMKAPSKLIILTHPEHWGK